MYSAPLYCSFYMSSFLSWIFVQWQAYKFLIDEINKVYLSWYNVWSVQSLFTSEHWTSNTTSTFCGCRFLLLLRSSLCVCVLQILKINQHWMTVQHFCRKNDTIEVWAFNSWGVQDFFFRLLFFFRSLFFSVIVVCNCWTWNWLDDSLKGTSGEEEAPWAL